MDIGEFRATRIGPVTSSKTFILLFVNHQMTIRNSILLIRYNNRVNSESIVVPQKYTKESASFP